MFYKKLPEERGASKVRLDLMITLIVKRRIFSRLIPEKTANKNSWTNGRHPGPGRHKFFTTVAMRPASPGCTSTIGEELNKA